MGIVLVLIQEKNLPPGLIDRPFNTPFDRSIYNTPLVLGR